MTRYRATDARGEAYNCQSSTDRPIAFCVVGTYPGTVAQDGGRVANWVADRARADDLARCAERYFMATEIEILKAERV